MLIRVVRENFDVPAEDAGVAAPAPVLKAAVRGEVEQEPSRTGRSNNYYLRLDNVGEGEAQDVTVGLSPAKGSDKAWDLLREGVVEFISAGGSARYPLLIHMGNSATTNCTVTWRNEDGSESTSRQTLTL